MHQARCRSLAVCLRSGVHPAAKPVFPLFQLVIYVFIIARIAWFGQGFFCVFFFCVSKFALGWLFDWCPFQQFYTLALISQLCVFRMESLNETHEIAFLFWSLVIDVLILQMFLFEIPYDLLLFWCELVYCVFHYNSFGCVCYRDPGTRWF